MERFTAFSLSAFVMLGSVLFVFLVPSNFFAGLIRSEEESMPELHHFQDHLLETAKKINDETAQKRRCKTLTPLIKENSHLDWWEDSGKHYVKMSVFSSKGECYWRNCSGTATTTTQSPTLQSDDSLVKHRLDRQLWVVPAFQMRMALTDIHEMYPKSHVISRLEQLLGLRPQSGKAFIVNLWVDVASLFRPCPDPEVYDNQCDITFAEDVCPDHREWFSRLMAKSYSAERGYPWTRLGYTCDWCSNPLPSIAALRGGASNQGLCEFVIRDHTVIFVDDIIDCR